LSNGSQKSTGTKVKSRVTREDVINKNITIHKIINLLSLFKIEIGLTNISLSVNERGNLRKPVKKVFVKNPNMKKSNKVNHFVNTGYAFQSV